MDQHGDDFGMRWRSRAARLLQFAAVFVMVFTVTIGAAEERAVKSRVAPVYPEIAKRMKNHGCGESRGYRRCRRKGDRCEGNQREPHAFTRGRGCCSQMEVCARSWDGNGQRGDQVRVVALSRKDLRLFRIMPFHATNSRANRWIARSFGLVARFRAGSTFA